MADNVALVFGGGQVARELAAAIAQPDWPYAVDAAVMAL